MIQITGSPRQNDTLDTVVEVLKDRSIFLITFPEKAPQDTVAASLALYFSLLKLGKDVYLVASDKPQYQLPGIEKIQDSIDVKGDSLKISFPYTEGSVDKIDWKIEGDKFNIIITPMQGYPKLDPSKVEFSYIGGAADCFIVLGAATLNSLGKIYTENKETFQGEIVNIDRHFTNARFGTVNFVNIGVSSLSEVVYGIIKKLGVELDQDIATCLYAGIVSATNNFTGYNVKPETLETAASLLRAGAKKMSLGGVQTKPFSSAPPVPPARPTPFSVPQVQPIKPVENKKVEVPKPPSTPEPQSEKKTTPPQDWLKPKIFSGKKIE